MADLSDWQCLHADDDLLVVGKPAGMLSVPGRGPDKQDCLLARVQQESGAKILLALKAFSMFSLAPLVSRYLSGTCASGPRASGRPGPAMQGSIAARSISTTCA